MLERNQPGLLNPRTVPGILNPVGASVRGALQPGQQFQPTIQWFFGDKGAGVVDIKNTYGATPTFTRATTATTIAPALEAAQTGHPIGLMLDFADLGSGEVDTTTSIGSATPTFTRATTATTVDSTGTIISVASGTPRSYYDPTTLEYLGYLAEGARTNLCLQSEDFATTWGLVFGGTVDANAAVSPDGTTTADRINNGGVNAIDGVSQTIALTGAQTYTLSLFLKQDTTLRAAILSRDGATFLGSVFVNFSGGSLSSLTVNSGSITPTASYVEYPNGWYRVSATFTATLVTNAQFEINADRDNTSKSVFAWGAQFESAAFASSYIPTTTASVTRNADVLTYPTTGWLSATAGTLYAEGQILGTVPSTPQTLVSLDDATTANAIDLRRFGDGASTGLIIFASSVQQTSVTTANLSNNVEGKFAGAYITNNAAWSMNGSTVTTDTSVTVPTVSQITVGLNGGGTRSLFGPIRQVAYIAERIDDADLQTLTTDGIVLTNYNKLISVASGDPRSYYDPETGLYLGYLAEGARTNLLLRSEEFDNAAWNNANPVRPTVTPNSTSAPDGTTTADTLTATNTADSVRQVVANTTVGVFAWSVFLKNINSTRSRIAIFDDSGGFSARANANIDWTAGVPSWGTVSAGTAGPIIAFPNGWYRVTILGTTVAGLANVFAAFYPDSLVGTNATFAWGAQLEAASFASSYIPTTTASVTRNADVLTYPTTGWLNASAGTLFAKGQYSSVLNGQNFTLCSLSIDVDNFFWNFQTNGFSAWIVRDATVNQCSLNISGVTVNTDQSQVGTYATNDFQIAGNGTLGTADVSGTIPLGTVTLNVGHLVSGSYLFGPIRRVAYWNKRLSDAHLRQITGGAM